MAFFKPRKIKFKSSQSQIKKSLVWAPNLGFVDARQGKGTVQIDATSINKFMDSVGARVGPAVTLAYQQEIQPVVNRAFRYWPINTGKSKSEMSVKVTSTNDFFRYTIAVDVWYATRMRRGTTAKTLLFTPLTTRVVRFRAQIARGITR